MPCQEGDERSQGYHHEEWEAGDPGRLSDLWHENVQNREGLKPTIQDIDLPKAGYPYGTDIQPFFLL